MSLYSVLVINKELWRAGVFSEILTNLSNQKLNKRVNQKSHWLQVSASKLLGDESGSTKMANGFFGQMCGLKTEKVSSTIDFCIFELV